MLREYGRRIYPHADHVGLELHLDELRVELAQELIVDQRAVELREFDVVIMKSGLHPGLVNTLGERVDFPGDSRPMGQRGVPGHGKRGHHHLFQPEFLENAIRSSIDSLNSRS